MLVAECVLNHLSIIGFEDKDVYSKMFDNCREQGYTFLKNSNEDYRKNVAVSFAENRSSDEIVVYVYPPNDFNGAKAKYFKAEQYSKVASYISSIFA